MFVVSCAVCTLPLATPKHVQYSQAKSERIGPTQKLIEYSAFPFFFSHSPPGVVCTHSPHEVDLFALSRGNSQLSLAGRGRVAGEHQRSDTSGLVDARVRDIRYRGKGYRVNVLLLTEHKRWGWFQGKRQGYRGTCYCCAHQRFVNQVFRRCCKSLMTKTDLVCTGHIAVRRMG